MKAPLISIDNFSGGMTLNEKLGKVNQFHIGYGVDFSSKPGCVAPGYSFTNMTYNASEAMDYEYPYIIHTMKDGNLYFIREDSEVHYRSGNSTLGLSASAVANEAARGCAEYKSFLYIAFKTAVYRKDLTQAVNEGYTANWQTGLNDSTYHPIWVSANNKMYVGHGNKIASWDGTTWTASALDLADNWEIRALTDFGILYLAIGASYYTSTHLPSKSRIFLWNRTDSSWNDEIVIPEPEIKAMIYEAGYLWIWAGRSCNLYVVPEGSRRATKIWTFVKENPIKEFQVYPGAVLAKNGTIYFGLSNVDSASDDFNPAGIYSFPSDPERFSLNLIWKGDGYNEKIYGMGLYRAGVDAGGDIIHFSRENSVGTAYRRLTREKTYSGETCYDTAGEIESFRYSPPANKQMFTEAFGVEFEPLPAGTKTSLYYGKDGASPTTAVFEDFTTTSATEKIVAKRVSAKDLKLKLKLQGSTTTTNRQFIKRIFVTGNLTNRIY
jgi:hypothetical protein